MQILKKANDIGPATALTPNERSILIDMARIGENDVFYDLGSGNGRLVVVVKKTKGNAVGIEIDYQRFCNSVRYAQRSLSHSQLNRVEFYCVSYDEFDFSDATVIYEGHERDSDEVDKFNKVLKGKKARIITIDLPLVRCKVFKTASYRKARFFMNHAPLNRSKAKNKNEWACWTLQQPAKISDVYARYDSILKRRGFSRYIRAKSLQELRSIVNSSFG